MKTKNTYQKRYSETATYFLIKPNGDIRPCVNKQVANAVQYEFGGEIISRKQAVERKLV